MGIITNAISSALGLSTDLGWQWRDHIHPASFRGVPFGVISGENVFGRRVAVHEYPFKDTVYVEDLGRSTRKFTIRGFLIQDSLIYESSDVFSQRDNLISAVETKGSATLVHPTLGELTVYVTDGGLQVTEGVESERVFEFTLTVIETGEREFSAIDAIGIDAKTNWLKTITTAATRYIAIFKGEINSVARAIQVIKGTNSGYLDQVQSVIDSVSNLGNVLSSTFGNKKYSRYNTGAVGGRVSGVSGNVAKDSDTRSESSLVDEKIASSVVDREKVTNAIEKSKNPSTIEEVPENIINIIEKVIDAQGSTKEKINGFETLSKYTSTNYQSTSQDQFITEATVSMLVCMSACSMAYMALLYTPSNLEEAQSILNRVCEALERALLLCADEGNDECYNALLNQRNSFIKTYISKFAGLSAMMKVTLSSPATALNLANRFYQDANRSEELVQAANPVHPAFMPMAFMTRRD